MKAKICWKHKSNQFAFKRYLVPETNRTWRHMPVSSNKERTILLQNFAPKRIYVRRPKFGLRGGYIVHCVCVYLILKFDNGKYVSISTCRVPATIAQCWWGRFTLWLILSIPCGTSLWHILIHFDPFPDVQRLATFASSTLGTQRKLHRKCDKVTSPPSLSIH